MNAAVCFSPHPDDAALSCGGWLALQAAQGRPAHVVTVFAGPTPPPETWTPFARALHRSWGDRPDPMAHRRAEDAEALRILGCTATWWDYRDAIYRHPGYDSRERIFGPPAEEQALEDELVERCASVPGTLLLFPLAVGHHVDHQLLWRVGIRLAGAGRPCAFYEDLPYAAWEGGPEARLRELPGVWRSRPVDVTAQWGKKVAAVSCYASQFAELSREGQPLLEALESYARSLLPQGYGERLWVPEGGAMDAIERARALYQGKDATHDFDHVLRVLALVRRIGPAEGADMRILEAAALLHDIARDEETRTGVDHALVGAERARQIVREWGYTQEEADAIARAIAGHRFRNAGEPETIEARVLYDADKLDAIGAIGVGRAFAYAGYTGQRLWTPVPPDAVAARPIDPSRHSPVIEFAVKLSRLADTMYTATGRALARERHAFMAAFFERLEAEVRGER